MTEPIFTAADAWAGGSYELALELGPTDDDRLSRTLRALWSSPDLDGCYQHRDREPRDQPRLVAGEVPLETTLHGVARIGAERPVACSSVVVRYDDGDDWIYFGMPLGSLGNGFSVGGYPFEDGGDLAWRAVLDQWLRALGQRVFGVVPFRLGVIGWDGGDAEAAGIAAAGVPAERYEGYLVPEQGGLRWYAPTRGAPFTFGRQPDD